MPNTANQIGSNRLYQEYFQIVRCHGSNGKYIWDQKRCEYATANYITYIKIQKNACEKAVKTKSITNL
jgi:hypothetical protein